MLNMGYFFDGSFQLLKNYSFISESLRGETDNRFKDSILGYVPVPFPAEFVQGIDTQKRDFEKGLESYLFGKYQNHDWWYYCFVVLALKEPLGMLILFLAAMILTLRFKEYQASWSDEALIAVPFLVPMAVLCSQTGFSIDPRYLLPAMPFFYLFISRVGRVFERNSHIPKAAVAACLLWMTANSLYVYPYSMSYFNELVPVRKRPDILLGSCIDWGQDAYHLKRWLEKHQEAAPIRVEYPCLETIERLDIRSDGKPPNEPKPGWFALGMQEARCLIGGQMLLDGLDVHEVVEWDADDSRNRVIYFRTMMAQSRYDDSPVVEPEVEPEVEPVACQRLLEFVWRSKNTYNILHGVSACRWPCFFRGRACVPSAN